MLNTKVLEHVCILLHGDGSIELRMGDVGYVCSVLRAKRIAALLAHTISQAEQITGRQDIPRFIQDGIDEEIAAKEEWLVDLLNGKFPTPKDKEDTKNRPLSFHYTIVTVDRDEETFMCIECKRDISFAKNNCGDTIICQCGQEYITNENIFITEWQTIQVPIKTAFTR